MYCMYMYITYYNYIVQFRSAPSKIPVADDITPAALPPPCCLLACLFACLLPVDRRTAHAFSRKKNQNTPNRNTFLGIKRALSPCRALRNNI